MKVLGIDPGFAIMGYGIIEANGNHFSAKEYGVITTSKDMLMCQRLGHIYNELSNIIDLYKPDVVAIEELFFNNNAKTAIMVAQARGVAIVTSVNNGLEVFEYTPLQIKQALVGYGRADKKQIQFMVKYILGLDEVPKPDDTADALAIAICHLNSNQMEQKIKAKLSR